MDYEEGLVRIHEIINLNNFTGHYRVLESFRLKYHEEDGTVSVLRAFGSSGKLLARVPATMDNIQEILIEHNLIRFLSASKTLTTRGVR